MENDKIVISIQNEEGRIDKVLAEILSTFTRSQLQAWIKEGHVQVDGKNIKANYKVKPGDTISVEEPNEEPLEMAAENILLEVIYEDEDLLIVNKPSGMVVHPSKGHLSGTLVNALLFHVNGLSEGTASIRPGIVHRIDKDTSGLLVVAKNNFAHQKLAEQFLKHSIERKYVALVHGEVQHEEGTIEAPIARMTNNRLKRTVAEGGKPAITHFERLKEYKNFTLVGLQLETGRTHQIRVHMNYINHPVVGDPMYGPRESVDSNGQFLHAATIGFIHPTTEKWMEFEAPLPDYFKQKLENLLDKN